jgi:hypothetical protein
MSCACSGVVSRATTPDFLEQVVFAAVDERRKRQGGRSDLVMMDLLSGKKKAAPEGAASWLVRGG